MISYLNGVYITRQQLDRGDVVVRNFRIKCSIWGSSICTGVSMRKCFRIWPPLKGYYTAIFFVDIPENMFARTSYYSSYTRRKML